MKKKVLIIDDDDLLRNYMKCLLEDYYDVVAAGNGKDGMSMLLLNNPDLVVLDLVMPYMSGYHFLSVLNEKKLKPRVVVLTGVQPNKRDVLDTTNVLEVIQKPFTSERFLEKIKKHIN